MSRYQGYTDSMEVLIDLLNEQKKQTALLEKLVEQKEVVKNDNGNKLQNTVTRKPSHGRGSNNTK